MDRRTITIDPTETKLRRVGHVARRRMRIDGDALRNGTHTDGTLTVRISGFGSPVAGVPDSFAWTADRPIALVITRAGVDGEDVRFQVGPGRQGAVDGSSLADGSGIRSVAFCYDAASGKAGGTVRETRAAAAAAAARAFLPTGRERRSILALLLDGAGSARRAGRSPRGPIGDGWVGV